MTTLKEIAQSVLIAAETAALEDKLKILKEKFTLLAPTFSALKLKRNAEDVKDVWKALAKADPTPTKSYLQWIIIKGISAWKKKQVHFLLEDIPKIADSIDRYNTLKIKNKLKPEHKDINRIANYDDLFAIVISYPDADSVGDLKKKEEQAFYDNKAAELILNTSELKIVVPKTKAASIFFGKNTQWCTSAKNDNQFSSYNRKGSLYIILHKPTNKRWQFHFQEHQYMDEKDHDIDRDKFRKMPFFFDLVDAFSPIVGSIDLKYIDSFSYLLLNNPSEAATLRMIKSIEPDRGVFASVIAVWNTFPPTPAFLKKCLKFKTFKAYYDVHILKDTSAEAKMAYATDYSPEVGLKKYTFTEDQYIELMKSGLPNRVIIRSKIPITQKMFEAWLKNNDFAHRTISRVIDGKVKFAGPRPPTGARTSKVKRGEIERLVTPFITPKSFPNIYKSIKSDRERKILLVTCLDNPDYYDFASKIILSWPPAEQVKMVKSIYDYRDDSIKAEGGTAGDKLVFNIIKNVDPKLTVDEALNLARRSPSLFLQIPAIVNSIVTGYANSINSVKSSYRNQTLYDFVTDNPQILTIHKLSAKDWEKITKSMIAHLFEEMFNHSVKAGLSKDDKQFVTTMRVLFRQNPTKAMDLLNKQIDINMHEEFSFGATDEADELADWLVNSTWVKAMSLKIDVKNTYLDEFINSAGFLTDNKFSLRDKKHFKKMVEENKGTALKVAQFVGFDDTVDPVVP